MNLDFLDFEQPIAELEAKINELRHMGSDSELNLAEEIQQLEDKSTQLTKRIFSSLSTAQIVQLARHPQRPHSSDYIKQLFTEVEFLEGDRQSSCSHAIVGGLARFEGRPVMFIGHEKGRGTKQKIKHNFGMPSPQGYRKALRLMTLAEKFSLPVLTFIDTPGAHAGVTAEEHNQSEAIAKNLFAMAQLKTPIICTVIGEGGSGGALALGVGDRVAMLEHAIYSVISPEGCASILWKSASHAGEAAEAMGVTAQRLHALKLIDHIIKEPLGGAHRDIQGVSNNIKQWLQSELTPLQAMSATDLVNARQQRLLALGVDDKA
jgi:acetyl-CoA carboxylase carboxyl transferase subunit alpha